MGELVGDAVGMWFKRDRGQDRAAERGDLSCDDPDFPFCIEVKRYKSGCAAQPAWWDQACAAARACQKLPLLVYKYNHQQWKWRMPAEAVVRAGLPIEYKGCRDTSALDWGYAVEVDTRTAMMLIREMLV